MPLAQVLLKKPHHIDTTRSDAAASFARDYDIYIYLYIYYSGFGLV